MQAKQNLNSAPKKVPKKLFIAHVKKKAEQNTLPLDSWINKQPCIYTALRI